MNSSQHEDVDSKQQPLPDAVQSDDAKDANVPAPKRCWLCEEYLVKASSFINHLRLDHGLIVLQQM